MLYVEGSGISVYFLKIICHLGNASSIVKVFSLWNNSCYNIVTTDIVTKNPVSLTESFDK